MMVCSWHCVLLFCLVAASSVNSEMKLDCRPDHVTLVWKDSRSQADTSMFRLGNCFPTSFTQREVVFSVDLNDCNFMKLVTGNEVNYTNELIYTSSPESYVQPFSLHVLCSYERPKDWFPSIYEPVFSTYGFEDLVFHFGIMNADFSGPAESTTFPLGSMIPIMASVEQQNHQPLLLLMEECVAATTPELHPGSYSYQLITNKGCLVDSKSSRTKFEPRHKSSEIQLSLQAFRFALGQGVYLHCSLVAWDPNELDQTKKACHYLDHGWEFLDDTTYNNLCDCCDSVCKTRRKRGVSSGKTSLAHKAVIGPITITDTS